MILNHIKGVLGISELEQRVAKMENKLEILETHIENSLDHFGDYKNRSEEELKLMAGRIEELLSSVEDLIDYAETEADAKRAANLLRRLRNNKTRIHNCQTGGEMIWHDPQSSVNGHGTYPNPHIMTSGRLSSNALKY